jgi:hypothetical protein
METRGPKLEWLALFLLLPLMAILGYLEVRLQLSRTGHTVVQLGILFFIGFLANGWISANEAGMRRSQYSHKNSGGSRREMMNRDHPADVEEPKNKRSGFFGRLAALLKPWVRHS